MPENNALPIAPEVPPAMPADMQPGADPGIQVGPLAGMSVETGEVAESGEPLIPIEEVQEYMKQFPPETIDQIAVAIDSDPSGDTEARLIEEFAKNVEASGIPLEDGPIFGELLVKAILKDAEERGVIEGGPEMMGGTPPGMDVGPQLPQAGFGEGVPQMKGGFGGGGMAQGGQPPMPQGGF